MGIRSSFARGGLLSIVFVATGCGDFDTTRSTPPRSTLGRELYTVVCQRVGAQSLREDVTGESFDAICKADPITGKYADKVDVSKIPALLDPAYAADGTLIPIGEQQASRTYSIARIEALGRRREDIVTALDAALPDVRMQVQPPDGTPCDPQTAPDVGFHEELAATLGRMIDLYDDPSQTMPSVTRAGGRMLAEIDQDPDVQGALARFDARQGYRPLPIALGSVRPLLGYPRLVEMSRDLVAPMLAGTGPETEQAMAFDELLRVGYQEMRTPAATASGPALSSLIDTALDRGVLTRPRSFLEATREVLSVEKKEFALGDPAFIVRRDSRGYASVPLVNGVVPPPFIDVTGPSGAADGLPDVDALGRFITSDGQPAVSPLFTTDGRDGPRDSSGRALAASGTSTLYSYVDSRSTSLAALARGIKSFFAHGVPAEQETAMNMVGGLPVLAGTRDATPTSIRMYPPDPHAPNDWSASHSGAAPPAGLDAKPVSLSYRAFHPDDSAITAFVYAFGQIAGRPETDDLLLLAQKLFTDHPGDLASIMGLALEMRAIAAKHDEAKIPDASTFWDDVFAELAPIAHEPGLVEDILRGFADPKTLAMEPILSTYFTTKDDVSYDTTNINGPSKDLDTGTAPPTLVVPLDRTKPDVGANRSEMQKFLQLLHDTNGLSICTKDSAIVHIRATLPNTTIPINFDYPTDPIYTPLVCGIVGVPPPSKLERCAVFGYQNVMSLLLDVLLGKALLTVRDPCLNALMSSSIAAIAGGADHFLEEISGVDGFSLHPNLRGFARLLYFEAPYPGLPTDANATSTNLLTSNFLKDTIDPIESMVCDPAPFTAADGTVFPLRHCNTINDVLRARDPDALFPVDELGFVPSLQPLAGAFDKHHQPLLFARLFDVLHTHWGSSKQTKDVCDPTLPRTNARWCSQDGLVTYEPLLAEVLQNGAFARLQGFVTMLAGMQIPHCSTFDAKTHMCTSVVTYDGVHVLAEALSMMLDSTRTPGLTDSKGGTFSNRNDGQKTDALTAMALFVDAFKSIDRGFASYASANPADADRQTKWHAARSDFVDTFLTVDGKGPSAKFKDPTLVTIIPDVIRVLREQVAAHCTPGADCMWARHDLAQHASDSISGPTFAALVDLVDALRKNDASRDELERLMTYLLDPASQNEAQAGLFGALLDAMQIFEDDTNLQPLEATLARGLAPPLVDDAGNVVRRSLSDAALRSLVRIFEVDVDTSNPAQSCTRERDPNRAISALLTRLVTPMAADQPAPIEVLMSAIGDVNRADPSKTVKFDGGDYANVANEMSQFCLDESRGLEQFYSVIRRITQE